MKSKIILLAAAALVGIGLAEITGRVAERARHAADRTAPTAERSILPLELESTAQAQPVPGFYNTINVWSTGLYSTGLGVATAGTYCGTNNLSVNTNTLDVGNARYVGIQYRGQLTGAGTTTNAVVIEKSIDGNYWEPYDKLSTTFSGTTQVGYSTNYDIGGIAKLRFTVVTSAAGSAPQTNAYVTVKLK